MRLLEVISALLGLAFSDRKTYEAGLVQGAALVALAWIAISLS
jgi:hypothetical protein